MNQRDSLSSGCDVFHPLISVPGIVENRKMENLSVPVKESHARAYNCANRDGAKFGTLTERTTVHCCYSFEKALHASACTKRAHANCGRPGREFTTPYAHGKAKTHMAGLSPLPSLHCMRPANCISPEDEDRDTLLACAVLPDPSLSRFPVDRAWLRAPLRYARVSSAFARARCHAAGVSSFRGINPSTQGRVARYDSCGNTSNR